jgi:protein TonB
VFPAPGLLVSLVLHGGALAFVAGWNGPTEAPKDIEVSIVLETAAKEPSPMAAAISPPASPAAARVSPPARLRPAVQKRVAVPERRQPEGGAAVAEQDKGGDDPGRAAEAPGIGLQDGPADGGEADRPAAPSAGNPAPIYPMAARRASREGKTVLLVSVDADGGCGDVRIEESSGTPSLDQAAIAAVRHWRFTPARTSGRTVPSMIRVPVLFRLSGNVSGVMRPPAAMTSALPQRRLGGEADGLAAIAHQPRHRGECDDAPRPAGRRPAGCPVVLPAPTRET